MLFISFLILDALCILLALLLLILGRVRWVQRAALIPLGLGIISGIIGITGHLTQFPAWRLIVVLIFAAAITALICLLSALLMLLIFSRLQPPQPR
jgi:uncharacterized membrane protein YedE/YeeE